MVPKVLRTLSENMTNHTRNILWSSKFAENLSACSRSSIFHSSLCLLRIKNMTTKRARHNLRRSATRSAKKERKWKPGIDRERISLGVAYSQPRKISRRFWIQTKIHLLTAETETFLRSETSRKSVSWFSPFPDGNPSRASRTRAKKKRKYKNKDYKCTAHLLHVTS